MNFKGHRPESYLHKNEEILISLAHELHKIIKQTTHLFHYDSLQFDDEKTEKIAHSIIEFAEDIYLEIGIWRAYENYNLKTFGTPLPCTMEKGSQIPDNDIFNESRIQHFLWNIYGIVEPDLILSPFHQDLLMLSKEVVNFLNNSKTKFPRYSSVKKYLKNPEYDAHIIKRKLIWLGTKSYFFRDSFNNYLRKEETEEKMREKILLIDDFINQSSTMWSGLGVVDILPDLLVIPENRKNDIKTWYERHLAFYLVRSARGSKIIAQNIINGSSYRIVHGTKISPFKEGEVILGSTVKYGDDWYWSGLQKQLGKLSEDQIKELREDFIQRNSLVVYRYNKQLLESARTKTTEFYNEFVVAYGDDFKCFDSGLNYIASEQKREGEKYETLSEEQFEELKVKHKLKNKSPNFGVPENVLNCENGVAVYYNENVGQEIIIEFNDLITAFEKHGLNLSQKDFDNITSLFEDRSISPEFVKKIISLYGTKSIMKAYHIDSQDDIDYLLHKHKGQYYKHTYPTLTFN